MMDQQSEAAQLRRKSTRHTSLEQKICGSDADEAALQITTGDRSNPMGLHH